MLMQGRALARRPLRRACTLIAAGALLAGVGATAGPAQADTPAHTDVMFLFDTSGSMGGVLNEAKAEIGGVIEHINATLPDARYGVAEVRDYPASEEEAEGSEKPWKLDQALTADPNAVKAAIEPLFASGGGDGPESYGRALWETDTNPNVGWRDEARHVIVLVADNVPHDHELDEGIPEADWVVSPPWDTGEEKPGPWAIPGTQWTPSTNLDFQSAMTQLGLDGKPLEDVDFSGPGAYLPYWEHWAALSGGHALGGASGDLANSLTTLIETGATTALAPCPSGQERSASGVCVLASKPSSHPTATQVICNLVIATATDTCTATVGDAAPSGSTNPTGTVTFQSANGGLFLGTTCSLAATPMSGNVSSCSVQFLPPAKDSSFPAITATYSGDATHNSSVGQTHYGPASALSEHVDFSGLGTVHPNGEVEVPFECGFPCEVLGELLGGAAGGALGSASAATPLAGVEVLAEGAAKHGKKHRGKGKRKPALLAKGKVKLKKAGKGRLILKPTRKGRHALAHLKGSLHLTLKFSVRTLNGTAVVTKKQRLTLRPKAKRKHKRKHR